MNNKGFTTRLVHADRRLNKPENGAVHQAKSSSVLFEYEDIQGLVDVFQGKAAGHAYSRQSSSSINALQNILAEMENGIGALTFASGMAALTTTLLTLLRQGDHVVMSQYVFGNTNSFADTLRGFGIEVSFVDSTDVTEVQKALKDNTRMVFTETIANPVTQIADLACIGQLCQQQGLLYVIDNTMTPSYLFDAKGAGASLIISSLTKYIGGHGHVLGGVVVDTGLYDWSGYPNIFDGYKSAPTEQWGINQIKKKGLRDMGGCLTAESAHAISVGLETLALRMQKACDNAMKLATFLASHSKVQQVYYPGLAGHPQHFRARELFRQYGAILSLDLKSDYDCHQFLNELQLVLNATHLGDTRTLGLPVASTIFHEAGAEQRFKMGIGDNMVRLSVGIEDTDDLIADFKQALNAL